MGVLNYGHSGPRRSFYHRKVRVSNKLRAQLLGEVAHQVAEFQNAVDVVDEAAAERFGVNRTDLRVLGALSRRGPMSAGQLAEACGLSPGAMTTAIDRLERAGYARRVRDLADRRSVLVEITPEAARLNEEIYGPIAEAGLASLERYSDAELALLRDFLQLGRALQVEHAARIRTQGAPEGSRKRPHGRP